MRPKDLNIIFNN